MDSLNFAMLGTGRIADHQLAPALGSARGVQLWSVLSRDPDRAAGFAERHAAAAPSPGYTRLEELLDDTELDAVVIATPDKLHAAQAVAAAEAGKHVLVEKPMTTSVEDGERVVRACEDAGVTLGVAYHLRWHAGHRAIARSAREGELGELRHARAQWTWLARDASNWRAQPDLGGWWSLAGVGTHCLDMIRWMMVPSCGEVTEVTGVVSRAAWDGPHDETAVVALQFESGATAEFCSSVQFGSPSRFELYGADDYRLAEDTLGPHGAGTVRSKSGVRPYTVANPYVGELEDFADAIRNGRPPEVDGVEGLRNVELLARLPV